MQIQVTPNFTLQSTSDFQFHEYFYSSKIKKVKKNNQDKYFDGNNNGRFRAIRRKLCPGPQILSEGVKTRPRCILIKQ